MRTFVFWATMWAACDAGPVRMDGRTGQSSLGNPLVDTPATGPTWHRDIAPLLRSRCASCHREGGIGPFTVEQYAASAAWAPAMVHAVRTGSMPPFMAVESDECVPEVWFEGDTRLSEDELALLEAWTEAGTPEGDPSSAPPLEEPVVDDLVDPDRVVSFAQPYTIEPGTGDIYRCFRVEPGHDAEVYLTGVQVLPDNEAVVHHVLVWSDPKDLSAKKVGPDGSYPCEGDPGLWPTELLAAWTPGGAPTRSPAGTGSLLKAGGSIVVNVHYHHPVGAVEVDQTSIALKWTTEKPAQYTTWYLVDIPFGAEVQPSASGEDDFLIPAGARDHVETLVLDTSGYLPFSLPIFAITPHMHYLGTEMLVTVRREDEAEDSCLIHTPGYRFDFQTSYVYDADLSGVPVLNPGDKVEVRCTYDNSLDNPYMAQWLDAAGLDAPVDVGWGENTRDEMCMAMVGLVIPPVDLSEWF